MRGAALSPWLTPYLLVAPALLSTLVFLYGPILASAVLSVHRWNLLSPTPTFVGPSNFSAVLASEDFLLSSWNTFLYCAILIPAQIVLPLALALLLFNVRRSRLSSLYRAALFLPTIVAYSVAGVAWSWLLNPINGLFNEILSLLGLPRSRWHTDPNLALLCVSAITFWKNFGLNMLLWLAALLAIPREVREVREAALVDGASPLQRFWFVDLPLVSPTAFFIAVTTLFNAVDDIVGVIDVLTNGGPAGRSASLINFLWDKGITAFQFGEASAVAVILIALVLAVTAAQFAVLERRVHYA